MEGMAESLGAEINFAKQSSRQLQGSMYEQGIQQGSMYQQSIQQRDDELARLHDEVASLRPHATRNLIIGAHSYDPRDRDPVVCIACILCML